MTLNIWLLVFAHVCHIHKNFDTPCDHVWQFFDNYQTLLFLEVESQTLN